MSLSRFRPGLLSRLAVLALLGLQLLAPMASVHAQAIPDRLSDAEFWKIFNDISEADGNFRSENLLSNETGFQTVLAPLQRVVKPGGVYVGVGPEQNFTYIVALQPKIAFIVDVRRQNGLEHLLYKALMEISDNRADFLSRLFSRARPAGLDTNSTPDQLFNAYYSLRPDSTLFYRTLAAVKDRLLKVHGFALSTSDTAAITHVLDMFYQAGPGLDYNTSSGGGFGGRGRMPTYADLMVTTDGAGAHRSYLATEANYRWLREFEMKNLLVPGVGNFGGPKALRAVGAWVRGHGAVITTFYTSNVEQYLFQDGLNRTFYDNLLTWPVDATSQFIRSGGAGGGGFGGLGGMRSSLICSIQDLLKQYSAGGMTSYAEVLGFSH